MISYGKQDIDENDIKAVVSALHSDYLTQGPKVTEFEQKICDLTGARFAVAVANGTAALHIAVASLRLDKAKEGITSCNTFTASATSMIYNDLVPVFSDIDPETYNVTVDSVKRKMTEKTVLFIPVHFAGQACDMEGLSGLAKSNGIKIIEDAAHAIGSKYSDGSSVGNCKYSDLTIFSFHPVKTITTCEGGMITTNDEELYRRLISLRSHGITKNPDKLSINPGPWYYEMQELGFNYRMTDIQAALGVSQLNRLDSFFKRRREIISKYNSEFIELSWLKTPFEAPFLESCFHLYVLQIEFEVLGKDRKTVMQELLEKGVGTQVHYIPVHTQPYYQKVYGYSWGDNPVAEDYYQKALSIPLYPKMTDEEVDYVIDSIKKLAEKCTR